MVREWASIAIEKINISITKWKSIPLEVTSPSLSDEHLRKQHFQLQNPIDLVPTNDIAFAVAKWDSDT